MIFIRANPAFYDNMHPCGVDAATVPKTGCHSAKSACGPHRSNPCSAARVIKNQISDSKVVFEKTPLHRNETSEKTTISLDVAGFQPEHLKVEIEDHVLMVSGKRTNKLGDTFVTHRRFALKTDIYDEDSVHADLEDGVLEVTIQKRTAPKSRHVPITVTLASTKKNDDDDISSSSSTPVTPSAAADVTENNDETEVNSSENAPLGQSDSEEVVSVETVDDEDNEDSEEVLEKEGGRSKAASSPQTHDDAWEEVVQA